MMLRVKLFFVMALVLGLMWLKPAGATEGVPDLDTEKPNVLFIFADDFAYDCIAYTGNDEIKTPNLDQLARSGTRFTHAYNMGAWNGAVCLASRAMLNTGLTVWRANLKRKEMKSRFVDTQQLWSQRMSAAGYKTYMTGKWHVSCNAANIFDVAKDIRPGMPNQTKAGYHRPKNRQDKTWTPYDTQFDGYWKGGKHWSEIVADNAIEFLDDSAKSEQPFFMYTAFNAPHDPRQAPKEFVDMYPPDSLRLPQPFIAEYPFDLPMKKVRDEVLAPFPRTHYNVQVNRAEYYAIITHLDVQIGRILDHLEKTGQKENTMIVFTADHGLAVGHHGLMGKQNLFEHSMRVPFFVSGQGIPQDKAIDKPIYLQDVLPTTLDWAGADKSNVEFKSLIPQWKQPTAPHYDHIYGGYTKTQRCIIKDKMKLIYYPTLERKLLFDLENDPYETTDLSNDPTRTELIKSLTSVLTAEQKKLGDQVSISN